MRFKLAYTVRYLDIHSHESLVVTWPNEESIRLEFRSPTKEERTAGRQSFDAFLNVYGEFNPNKKSFPVFEAIAEGRRPPEGVKAHTADELVYREGPTEWLGNYPNAFIEFADNVCKQLRVTSQAVVSVLRWRYAQEGPQASILYRGFYFSNDTGASWHRIPGRYTIKDISPRSSVLDLRRIDAAELSKLAFHARREPLAHELLREAKSLEHSSPRSALLISVSAAEVAVKSLIVSKVPQARWLVDSVQSPPLVKILEEYVPMLFSDEKQLYVANKAKGLIKTLFDAVQIRNSIVHKGSSAPPDEKVSEIIRAVENLLWVCDYYHGHRWAEEYIGAF